MKEEGEIRVIGDFNGKITGNKEEATKGGRLLVELTENAV